MTVPWIRLKQLKYKLMRNEKEKSLPCNKTSQQDNDSKPDENYTICENDEDTMSCNDFMELRRRCVELDVMIM